MGSALISTPGGNNKAPRETVGGVPCSSSPRRPHLSMPAGRCRALVFMRREHRTAITCSALLQPDRQSRRSRCLKVLSAREFTSHGGLSGSGPPPAQLPVCLLNKMLNAGPHLAPFLPAPPCHLHSVLKKWKLCDFPSIRLPVVTAGDRKGFPEPGAVRHSGSLPKLRAHAPHTSRNK